MSKFKVGDHVIVTSGQRSVTGIGSYGVIVDSIEQRFGEWRIEFEYTTGVRGQNLFDLDESELDFNWEYILDKKLELLNEQV